ncbi:MAG: PAS domain S-box protein [Chloroflexi bacterium]|nr:PAS domain S-box protein [Chloroflexota bacterium]MBP7042588.1 PAS domain S-box protein [Chloroflexota bacterium]
MSFRKNLSHYSFPKLWLPISGFLTQPAASLVELEARRRSRLLLIILLLFTLFGSLILIYEVLKKPEIPRSRIYGMFVVIWLAGSMLYVVARRGYTEMAAAVFIGLLFLFSVVLPLAPHTLSPLPYFIVFPLLLSALFFSPRGMVWLALFALLVTAVLDLFVVSESVGERPLLMETILFVLPFISLVLFYENHHRGIECIHHAELQESYNSLLASEEALQQYIEEHARERHLFEKSLREAQHRYYGLFEQSHDAVFILSLEGAHLEANQRAADLLDFSHAEMQNLTVKDLSAEIEQSEKVFERLLVGEHIPVYERIFRKKDGRPVPVEINVELVRDTNGRPLHIQSIVRDISERKHQENQLRLQSTALEAAANAILITDRDGRIEWSNRAYAQLTGYSFAESIGQNSQELLHSGVQDPVYYKTLWDTILSGQIWRGQTINRRKDGRLYTDQQTITPVLDQSGAISHFIVVKEDVTERESTQLALRESEALYRSMFENNLAVKLLIDPRTGQIVDANPAAANFYGYSLDHLKSLRIQDINILTDAEIQTELALAVREQHHVFNFRHRLADGEVRDVEVFSGPIVIQGVEHLHSIILDVTARKRAEEALRQNEERLQMILQGTQAGTWEWNVLTGETIVNERWAEIVGYTLDELSPSTIETWSNLTHPDDLYTAMQLLGQHFTGESSFYTCEMRMKHKDGRWVWIWDRGKVMTWTEDGMPLRMLGTHIDITEHKTAEEALRQSEARQRAMFEAIPDLIFRNKSDGTLLDFHTADFSSFFVPTNDLIGKKIDEFLPEGTIWQHKEFIHQTLETQKMVVREFGMSHDGAMHRYEVRIVPVGRTEVLSIIRDVTELWQTRRELEIANDRLEFAVTTARIAWWEMDVQTGVVRFDPRKVLMAGYDPQDFVDVTYHAFTDRVHPDDHAPMMQAMRDLIEGRSSLYSVDYRLKTASGGWIWFHDRGEKAISDEGRQVMRGFVIDITENKLAELRKFELALEKERVYLLREFIEKASHEFRTPLSIVNTHAFIMAQLEDPARRRSKAETIQQQVMRIAKLLDMLLLMTKLNSGVEMTFSPVDLAAICKVVCQATIAHYGNQPRLTFKTEPNLPPLLGEAFYLESAIGQILDNAYRYTPKEDAIEMSLGTMPGFIWLAVCDSGPGIPEEEMRQIFDTFWRRDQAHTTPGFGLGLPIAQSVVRMHSGRIEVENNVGRGTTFRILLPVATS